MAFCTVLIWDRDFPMAKYEEMVRRSGHDKLPAGCLSRIVGSPDGGAAVIEVWQSPDDARKFSEENQALLAEFAMPKPDRVSAFETSIYATPATAES
jgi:hypothetical protein